MGDHHDDHDDTAYLLKSGRVHLSLEELSNLLRSVQKPTNAPKSALGNPGPLGLGGFALTTMTLSIYNAGILTDTSNMVLALALFYGGIAQFIAGLYEYKISNTFGATAFCSYGAFWCSFATYVYFIVPHLPPDKVHEASGLFLFMWLIFTLYMTVAALRVSFLLAALFSVLSVTFVLLVIGDWAELDGAKKAGGVLGMVTAGLAWYGSAASVINTTWDRELLPLGLWVRPKPKYRKENTETVMPLLELTTMSSESDDEDVEKGKDRHRHHHHKERVFLSSVKEAPARKQSGH